MEDYQDRMPLATAEGLELEVVLAGVGSRIVGRLIDLFAVFTALSIVYAGAFSFGTLGYVVIAIGTFLTFFGYDPFCEQVFNGRNLGKRVMGMRVLRAEGVRVDFLSSMLRCVLLLLELFTIPILGLGFIFFGKRNQRLGDLAGGTVVVREAREPKAAKPAKRPAYTPVPPPQPVPPAPTWSPPAARAPESAGGVATATRVLDTSKVTREDMAAISAFLERRNTLAPHTRSDIAARMANALRSRVAGATGDLSDEGLLEAVVAAKNRHDDA